MAMEVEVDVAMRICILCCIFGRGLLFVCRYIVDIAFRNREYSIVGFF